MRSWEDYKKTMRSEDEISEFARSGDLLGLARALNSRMTQDPSAINAKDEKGNSPLMLAAYHGHTEAVAYLLKIGADPNTSDRSGNTVLMGVAFKGHLAILQLLLAAGADPALANPRGQIALHFAQMFGRADAALLLARTRDTASQDAPQRTNAFGLRDILAGWLTFFRTKHSALRTGRRAS